MKLAINHPLIVIPELFKKVEQYESMIKPIVSSISLLLPYTYDILSYFFIEYFTRESKNVEYDLDLNLKQNLQSNCSELSKSLEKNRFSNLKLDL